MTPLIDHRPFPLVLADFIARHGGSAYAVSRKKGLLSATDQTINNWLRGSSCVYEREVRSLMTLIDEGRA